MTPATHACAGTSAPYKETVLFCPVPAILKTFAPARFTGCRHEQDVKKLQTRQFCENVIAKSDDHASG
jgi:hypothetical protein